MVRLVLGDSLGEWPDKKVSIQMSKAYHNSESETRHRGPFGQAGNGQVFRVSAR